jgi:dTDP-4-dehydrorhamnose 3,5-epimerase
VCEDRDPPGTRAKTTTVTSGPNRAGLAEMSGSLDGSTENLFRASAMNAVPVPEVQGVLLFTPSPHVDERGFFVRTFDSDIARHAGLDPTAFLQDSLSRSTKGVVRGLHTRRGKGEAKLVRCSYGAVFDVVVDLRRWSTTYRNWKSFELSGDTQMSLFIPAGCAHGFQALTDIADVEYRIDRRHDPSEDVAIAFDDPELSIPWPLPVTDQSTRDRVAPPLSSVLAALHRDS